MSRFRTKTRAEDEARAPWWDRGQLPPGSTYTDAGIKPDGSWEEVAVFKARISEADSEASSIALEPLVAELRAAAKERKISDTLTESLERRMTITQTLLDCLDHWTFRADPEDGRPEGEPGPIVPLTRQAITDLDLKDFVFLVEEMGRRLGVGDSPTDGGTGPEGPAADALPPGPGGVPGSGLALVPPGVADGARLLQAQNNAGRVPRDRKTRR